MPGIEPAYRAAGTAADDTTPRSWGRLQAADDTRSRLKSDPLTHAPRAWSVVAQRLTRKLADAMPGEEIEIVCWDNPHDCTRQGDGFQPPFSSQYATVEQSGRRLPSADASELYSKIKAAEIEMITAGNTSGWMLVAMKDELTVEWHVELIGAIAAKFAVHPVAEATLPARAPVTADASSSIANPFGL